MISYNEFRAKKTCFEKAQTQNPVVLKTAANNYIVLGATAIYSVKTTDEYSVDCNCPAGKHGKFCYHAASALLAQLETEAEDAHKIESIENYTERFEENEPADYVQ
jgi:hypothetical protein